MKINSLINKTIVNKYNITSIIQKSVTVKSNPKIKVIQRV